MTAEAIPAKTEAPVKADEIVELENDVAVQVEDSMSLSKDPLHV